MKHYLVTVDKCTISWLVQADTPQEAIEVAHQRHVRGEAPEKIECEETMAHIEEVHIRRVSIPLDQVLREFDGEGN